MGLNRKLVSQIRIKSDADVFHKLFKEKPHHLAEITPQNIQNCDLHRGEWGTVGSIIYWNYIVDGKEKVAKERIEAIDEGKKSVTFKMIEGDLAELYESFKASFDVDVDGDDNLVTWTFEYEKVKEDDPEPQADMDFILCVTKDIETHYLANLA